MKFYTSVGPNPRVVKLFMTEKGIEIPEVSIDLRGGENRRAPYNVDVNPAGQTPALELDDGSFLCEVTAICEYLDERFPEPTLIGSTAEERANTRMWTRRVDLKICEPLTNGFRFAEGLPLFEPRLRCLPEAADGLKATAQDGINGSMRRSRGVNSSRATLSASPTSCCSRSSISAHRSVSRSTPPIRIFSAGTSG